MGQPNYGHKLPPSCKQFHGLCPFEVLSPARPFAHLFRHASEEAAQVMKILFGSATVGTGWLVSSPLKGCTAGEVIPMKLQVQEIGTRVRGYQDLSFSKALSLIAA